MTAFILTAIVFVAISLLMILPPMLRKNQPLEVEYDELNVSIAKDRLNEIKQQLDAGEIEQSVYQQLHDELEATLALDLSKSQATENQPEIPEKNKISPIIVALSVPVMAVVFYAQLGSFDAVTSTPQEAVNIPAGEDRPQMTIEEAIGKLQQRLQEEPDNAEGWFMLAKTYMTTQQYPQAVSAYQTTIELVGEEPQLLLAYADALAMTEGGSLTGAARPVVEKVLLVAPESPTVLWMAGTSESQLGNYSKALTLWYKLRPMLANEPQALSQLDQMIASVESNVSADELVELQKQVEINEDVTAVSAQIMVEVDLDPQLRSQVSDSDVLFVFAKALEGPPMPLAAVKQTVSALPLTVTLNDAMAMMPQMKLSNFDQVAVSAVISKSGQPGVKPGDPFVEVSPVSVAKGETIKLLIQQIQQ